MTEKLLTGMLRIKTNKNIIIYAQLSGEVRDTNSGLSLHQSDYFVCASSKGSGENASLCRLV